MGPQAGGRRARKGEARRDNESGRTLGSALRRNHRERPWYFLTQKTGDRTDSRGRIEPAGGPRPTPHRFTQGGERRGPFRLGVREPGGGGAPVRSPPPPGPFHFIQTSEKTQKGSGVFGGP